MFGWGLTSLDKVLMSFDGVSTGFEIVLDKFYSNLG